MKTFAFFLSKDLLCAPFCRKNASRLWHDRNLTASQTHMMTRCPPLLPTPSSRPGAAGGGSAPRSTQKRMLSAMCARSALEHCKYGPGSMFSGSGWWVHQIIMIEPAVIENSFSTFACPQSTVLNHVLQIHAIILFTYAHMQNIFFFNYNVKSCCCWACVHFKLWS